MTEEAGFAEPAPPAAEPADAEQPGTGPVAEDTPGPEPGTGAPGAEPAGLVQDGVPAEPDQPEPAETETVSPSAGAPDPVEPPFIPADGVAPWLRDALTWLHERLRNLGG